MLGEERGRCVRLWYAFRCCVGRRLGTAVAKRLCCTSAAERGIRGKAVAKSLRHASDTYVRVCP